jgi:hypothetical protein
MGSVIMVSPRACVFDAFVGALPHFKTGRWREPGSRQRAALAWVFYWSCACLGTFCGPRRTYVQAAGRHI